MTASTPLQVAKLQETVINGGYCVGCGACASLVRSPIEMRLNEFGQYVPSVTVEQEEPEAGFDVGQVCPFYATVDETRLAAELYPSAPEDAHVGRYLSVAIGHVSSEGFRDRGSSGGMTSWILHQLLESGRIDGVLHVKRGTGPLFEYGASTTAEGIAAGAKSRYYPVEMSQVIAFLRANPGRYAFVGIPCFVKAVRLLARYDDDVASSLAYCIAIFCGHLKSTSYADMLAWQMGVPPGQLEDIDFRVKLPDRPASRYGVLAMARGEDGSPITAVAPAHDLFGTDWGQGMFKPQACDFCDDIAGETADITLGDAWLPGYQDDSAGTNIIVVRHPVLQDLLQSGRASGALQLVDASPADVYRSQAGNYRHRREGLSYRMWVKSRQGQWHPQKRVPVRRDHLSRTRRRIYDARVTLSARSHTAFLQAKRDLDFGRFLQDMAPLVAEYTRLYRPWWRRLARHVKRILTSWRTRT